MICKQKKQLNKVEREHFANHKDTLNTLKWNHPIEALQRDTWHLSIGFRNIENNKIVAKTQVYTNTTFMIC